MLVGPNGTAVDHGQRASERTIIGRLRVQLAQDLIPDAGWLPAAAAAVDGAPRPVAFGEVAPRGTSAQDPVDAIADGAVILVRATGVGFLGWQERREARPLRVGQVMSMQAPSLPLHHRLCRHTLGALIHRMNPGHPDLTCAADQAPVRTPELSLKLFSQR